MNIAAFLDYHELTESNLDMALNDILHNPIYRDAVKNISKKFLDRPRSPMDEACYWVEYVIRYGKKALRSPAIDLSWWQIELLDFHDLLQDNILHSCVSIFGNEICEAGFTQPQIQRLIKNPPMDPPYDVVITEVVTAHCFMGFGYHLKVPVIGLSASFLPPWVVDILANPSNLAFVSNNFGSDAPNVRELEQDLALVLINSHLSITGVKPITPAHVEVGGLHIQDDDSELPADHKKWLDESRS
ncbi:hypothetical protein PV326_014217, partial [Microctonus aethiopoides]